MNSRQKSSRLNVALVGSGNMAKTHARHWASIPEAKIVAIASTEPSSAREITTDPSIKSYSSLDNLLSAMDREIDIVDICTPTLTHHDLAISALNANKHLFLEKPMARSVAECDQIIDAAAHSQTIAMVGHVLRYFPEYALAHSQVKSGAVGTPAAIRTARLSGFPNSGWNNWYADLSQSGGVILDLIIHDFDWLLWTFGPVDRVFSKGMYGLTENPVAFDYALVTLHHVYGALSHVTGSWAHSSPMRTTFEICGDRGMLEHDSASVVPLTVSLRETTDSKATIAYESPLSPVDDPYYREIRHFADCVLSHTQPDITLQDARNAVQVAEAALQSLSIGLPVVIQS